jgi:hypothetical protein
MSEALLEVMFQRFEAKLEVIRAGLERLEERMKPEPTCLTYPLAAKRLGVGLTKLKEMVKRGEIRKSLVGKVPMISLSEIQRVSTPEAERPRLEAKQRKAAWVPLAIHKKR